MSRAGIPEWFIGGPLHGKDRRTEVPGHRRDLFAVPEAIIVRPDHDAPLPDDQPTPARQRVYARRTFAIGRTVLVIWTVDGMQDHDIGDQLAEILLAPHHDPEPG